MSGGICGGQSGTGAGFLGVLRFPLPILIPQTTPHSSSSVIRGWYNRPISGRRTNWTRCHTITFVRKEPSFLRTVQAEHGDVDFGQKLNERFIIEQENKQFKFIRSPKYRVRMN
jgi:hypothetical protein